MIVILPISQFKVEGQSSKSYPISYSESLPESYPMFVEGAKTFVDQQGELTIEYNKVAKVIKENDKRAKFEFKNVIKISREGDMYNRYNFKIIPLKVFEKDSALSILERYIVNHVGFTEKADQKLFKLKDFDVAQIGYQDFKDHYHQENVFSIYTLMLKGNRSWVIIGSYTPADMTINEPLLFTKEVGIEYLKLVNNFKVTNIRSSQDENANDLRNEYINEESIKEYKKNNSKFITTL